MLLHCLLLQSHQVGVAGRGLKLLEWCLQFLLLRCDEVVPEGSLLLSLLREHGSYSRDGGACFQERRHLRAVLELLRLLKAH